MPTQIKGALAKLTGAIRDFTVAQRTIALIGLAMLALVGFALFTFASRPTYTPLYSGLSGEDANALVEQLRTDGIDYELTEGGATILVPEEAVYDQRLKAAAAGIPSSSTGGYSLLDDMGVTSSDFQQSVTYKRAIEGELAATIGAMSAVQTASVRLAMPEETVFVSEQADPTASVFIETAPGADLSTDQVQAIVHLVSASVEGMSPQDVAVIDSEGKVLSAVGVGATGTADQQASDYEERVTASVQAMLDRVVGPGNATVVVAADMNYASGERLEETFTSPEGSPALNESTATEEYEGAGGAAAGVLGPDNIAVPDDGEGEGNYTSEQQTRNNALNKVTETTTTPAGSIERQAISVAVDTGAAAALDRQALADLVAAAAGVNQERGDVVTVEVLQFNTAGADEAAAAIAEAEAAAAAERQGELVRNGVIAAGVLLLVLIAFVARARSRRRQRREDIPAEDFLVETGHLSPIPEPVAALEAPAQQTVQLPTALPPREPVDADRKRAEIDALAAAEPARTAEYLRTIMDDRQPA